ncbi:LysR family transcriptional regulator [uncultured Parasutterella sp.]|uniref:LysR family transcriptional regulator n=1 Tax=uncultured Parasutterella sp. TaxID=1263098 RepID=UPI0025A64E17|nr:LysR family transcriptional regulator [uncultured Parasutterella sp.]
MSEEIINWTVFIVLYDTGSVSETAVKLKLDNSAVSKKIKNLEKKLGVTLFDRSARPFLPTQIASELIEPARSLVNSREKIKSLLSSRISDETQIVRLMVGNSQRKYLPKIISKFLDMHPQMRINVISPLDIDEFKRRLADIAFISGSFSLPDYILRSRGRMLFVPVASPEYIQAHGQITEPDDLSNHRIFWNLYQSRYSFLVTFPLRKGNTVCNVPQGPSLRFSNVEMVKDAALQGIGVAISMPLFACIDELESGALVPVLNGWHRPSQENYVAIHREDWNKPFVRCFAEYLAQEFSAVELDCESRLKKLVSSQYFKEICL